MPGKTESTVDFNDIGAFGQNQSGVADEVWIRGSAIE
jgi:hypothetical protein